MGQVPAATRALAVLKVMAAAAGPIPAATIARELGLPRSSTYHLLTAMRESGFVVHLPEDERWALGVSAFEIGTAFTRHDPLERLARPILTRLVRAADRPASAHLAVVQGHEAVYIAKVESSPRLPLVTEVGVRLPAALTASGRAVLAALPAAQTRAAFAHPNAFTSRTGLGPVNWSELRSALAIDRANGFSEEDGYINQGFSSLAYPVHDHLDQPVAAIGITFESTAWPAAERRKLGAKIHDAATELSHRIGQR